MNQWRTRRREQHTQGLATFCLMFFGLALAVWFQ